MTALRLPFLLAAILLAMPASAQQAAQTYYAGPSKLILPLTRAPDGKLFLAAIVQGHAATLLIDSGGSQFLDVRLCERLGLKLTDATQPGYGLGGALPVKRGAADFGLGALTIGQLPVSCIDLGPLGTPTASPNAPHFDGIVGSELLALLRARLDYDKMTLELRRPTPASVAEEERRRRQP